VDGAPYTATSINNLASLYLYQKKYKKAEKLIRYLFEIRVTSLGPRDESVAHSLVALSHVFILQGRLDEAEMPYWKALQIYTNALGRQHPYVVSTLERLGALWQLQLKFDKVSKCQKILEVLRAGKDIDENLQSVLWSLPNR
jgi:tetratricopeptide (TPR) repeat protein